MGPPGLGNLGAERIAWAVAQNATLERLNLFFNNIGPVGASPDSSIPTSQKLTESFKGAEGVKRLLRLDFSLPENPSWA